VPSEGDTVAIADRELSEAVTAEAPFVEELLCRLVEAPTTFGHEEVGQEIVREALREAGLDPVDVPLDADLLRATPGASPFTWDVSGKANVVADWPPAGEGGRSLVLNGHVDVVGPAAESLWRTAPFVARRDGDWLYGRGSGDMKAGLAAVVGVVKALRGLGLAPLAPVQLQSVVEEECTGNGALQCVLTQPRPDAALIAEPFPGAISVAQVGVLWFHLDLAGVPAHVGNARDGSNAIEAAFPLVAALRGLEAELNADPPAPFDTVDHPINFNVGVIAGGDWPSTVAARCTLSCRLALYPGEEVEALQRRIEETVADAAAAHPYLAGSPPVLRYDGLAVEGCAIDRDDPLVTVLSGAYERLAGAAPLLVPTTATTDARAFLRHGVPAVCHGPWAENIHGVDERVHLPSVTETGRVLALFLRDWCGLAG
jgi:acetylornithine deacetylase